VSSRPEPAPARSGRDGHGAPRPRRGRTRPRRRQPMSTTVLGRRLGGERRLESLPLGTKVLLSSGKVAVLVACSFTRTLLRLDAGAEIAVAPGAELEVLEPVCDGPRDPTPGGRTADVVGAGEAEAVSAAPVSGPVTDARERAQRA